MTRAEQKANEAFPDIPLPHLGNDIVAKQGHLRGAYIHGYEQAEAETIEKACDWLFAHLPILVDYYNEDIYEQADRSEFIKLFRKQMEEE